MQKTLHKVVFQKPQIGCCPQLKNLAIHGFSWGKDSGNMDFMFGDSLDVRLRVQRFLTELNLGSIRDSINMIPEHSDRIIDLDNEVVRNLKRHRFGKNIQCDAMFTEMINLTLTTKPADCTTALVYVKNRSIIGIIHSGRRGVEKQLPSKAVLHICHQYSCKAQDIFISIIPHLFQKNRRFENVKDMDINKWKGFITKKDGYYYPDETGYAIKQYLDAGIPSEQVEVYDVDTYEEARKGNCFSYKYHFEMARVGKNVPEGRFIVAIRNNNKQFSR